MLRHNNVPEHNEPIPAPDLFKSRKEKIPSKWVIQERTTLVATKSHEMKVASTIESLRMACHAPRVQKDMDTCL